MTEVEEMLSGNDEKYRGGVTVSSSGFETPITPAHSGTATPTAMSSSSMLRRGGTLPGVGSAAKSTPYVPTVTNSSHLDAVPQPTPINRNRVIHKKVSFRLKFQ